MAGRVHVYFLFIMEEFEVKDVIFLLQTKEIRHKETSFTTGSGGSDDETHIRSHGELPVLHDWAGH